MGSGHILVYAFEVFMQLYELEGESPRNAAELILEKNLFGLDIDKRAFQLTYFALMMKGRQYSRRILSKNINPNVYVVPDDFGIGETELQLLHMNFTDQEKAHQDLMALIEGFQNSADLGSLIEFTGIDFENLRSGLVENEVSFFDQAIREMVNVGELLQQKYHVAVTNPPYMGNYGMNKGLSDFVKKVYPASKSDLFGVFIERLEKMTAISGYYAMITQHAWMFLSSFEKLRVKINNQTIINMAHLGTRAFEEIGGEVVQTTTFVMSPIKHKNYIGRYLRLVDFTKPKLKETKVIKAIETESTDYLYNTVQNNFAKIPGQPISYWVSENIFNKFLKQTLKDKFRSAGRMKTHDNNKYIRNFWEINFNNISLGNWKPYHNGGDYRKWYGNENEVVDMRKSAVTFYKEKGGYPNELFIQEQGITWNLITSATNSFRLKEANYLYSSAAPTIVNITNEMELFYDVIAFLNSSITKYLIQALNPTLNTTVGDVLSLPFISLNGETKQIVEQNIELAEDDWNASETSWKFAKHVLM